MIWANYSVNTRDKNYTTFIFFKELFASLAARKAHVDLHLYLSSINQGDNFQILEIFLNLRNDS